jgi:dipeptidyl aminopeptidase/acylaminoacyl peptidase
VTLDGRATSVASVGENAKGLSWSPDGQTLAWSGGPRGEEDLYATDIVSGVTRALTALPGQESRPAWSPDGRWLAFRHTGSGTGRLRVLAAGGALVERADQATDLGPAPGASPYTPLDAVLQWSGDGSSLLVAQPGGEVIVVPLDGIRRTLRVPVASSAIRLFGQDSVVYLLEDRLYAAQLASDSTSVAEGRLLTGDAALYPAVAHDGRVLYVSTDGLRLRRLEGSTVRLGWPIRFRTPTPSDVVIRNVRVVTSIHGAKPS